MNMNYTWSIVGLHTLESPEGFVYRVDFSVKGSDGYLSWEVPGSCFYEVKESYVPFTDLTEDQVLGWVSETLGPQKIAKFEEICKNYVDELKNPTPSSASLLPWK